MLYESAHVCFTTDDGIGTLRITPPGGWVGAGFLRDLLRVLEIAVRTPGIEIVVVRSGTPLGFGFGLAAESLDEALPRLGQRVTNALAELPVPTIAFLEGPVTGPGLELALACDFRLAVAGPDSWVYFGELAPGWGGRTRLRLLGVKPFDRMTAREAVRAGVFDQSCSERRGKIELRTWLDRLQFAPRKPAARWRSWFVDTTAAFASERRAFRAALREGVRSADPPRPTRPLRAVGLVGGTPATRHLAAECSMRGVPVVWVAGATGELFAEARRRGRLTPLEAEQAGKRVRHTDDAETLTACDWVILTEQHSDLAGMLERELPPRTLLCVPPADLDRATLLAGRPDRVIGLRLQGDSATLVDADPVATATVAGWLGSLGVRTTTTTAVVPVPALA